MSSLDYPYQLEDIECEHVFEETSLSDYDGLFVVFCKNCKWIVID